MTVGGEAPARQPWDYLRALFENSPEAVGLIDTAMRLMVWNRAARHLTGSPGADMLGRRCRLEGARLVIDVDRDTGRPEHAQPGRTAVPALCVLDIAGSPGPGTRPVEVVASLTALRHEDAAYLMHVVPAARLVMGAGVVAAGLHATGEAPRGRPRRVLAELTRREHQVLALLAAGKTAKPIATELAVSLTTVRTHIQHILAKLGVHSCLEAVVCLLRATVEEPSAHGLGEVAARLASTAAETSSLLRIAGQTETRFDQSALLDAAGA